MALIGYARVSRGATPLEDQVAALRAAGCETVLVDAGAPGERLEAAVEAAVRGDSLVVTKLDRLSASIRGLDEILERLASKGASLRVLEPEEFDTRSRQGDGFCTALRLLADFERSVRKGRQREGIEAAKAQGIYRGRKPSVDPDEIRRALAAGERPVDIARRLKCARSTVYRLAG